MPATVLPPDQRRGGHGPRPVCGRCGLQAGNSLGVPVYWYMLQRSSWQDGRQETLRFGSFALCDKCIREAGRPPRRLRSNVA